MVEAENKAPVAKPRTNPSARMTVKQPEGHDPEVQAVVCPSRKETRAPPVAGEKFWAHSEFGMCVKFQSGSFLRRRG